MTLELVHSQSQVLRFAVGSMRKAPVELVRDRWVESVFGLQVVPCWATAKKWPDMLSVFCYYFICHHVCHVKALDAPIFSHLTIIVRPTITTAGVQLTWVMNVVVICFNRQTCADVMTVMALRLWISWHDVCWQRQHRFNKTVQGFIVFWDTRLFVRFPTHHTASHSFSCDHSLLYRPEHQNNGSTE